jgi:hypothetical protein
VRHGPGWDDEDAEEGEADLLGTVIEVTDDEGYRYVEVLWDDGDEEGYDWGEGYGGGSYGGDWYGRGWYGGGSDDGDGGPEIVVVDDAAPPQLAERLRVQGGPRCKPCSSGTGTVLSVSGGVATVEWDRGRIQDGLRAGVDGVLPAGGYDYAIEVGARVRRGAAWKHKDDDRGRPRHGGVPSQGQSDRRGPLGPRPIGLLHVVTPRGQRAASGRRRRAAGDPGGLPDHARPDVHGVPGRGGW